MCENGNHRVSVHRAQIRGTRQASGRQHRFQAQIIEWRGGTKSDNANRKVKIRGALRDSLLDLRAKHGSLGQIAYVFPTLTGGRLGKDNFRSRVFTATVKRARENLEAEGSPPLPEGLTPHSCRRSFCSGLYALGADPGEVMDELGPATRGWACVCTTRNAAEAMPRSRLGAILSRANRSILVPTWYQASKMVNREGPSARL
jgi:hypothetical protein